MPTYNLRDVILNVATQPIEGFGESDAISIERDEDSWIKTVGADGTATRSKTNNFSGRVTITLMQNSFSNAVLQTSLLIDELDGGVTFPVVISDALGTGWVIACDNCWVVRQPTLPFNKQVGELEWIIDCSKVWASSIPFAGITDFTDDFGPLPTMPDLPLPF